MDCNCININNGGAVFRHVYGNVLRMAIPLTVRTVELVDGEATTTDAGFIPSQDYPVEVILQRENRRAITIEATMRDGNIAYIEDLGTVPVGQYAITVMCKDDNGNPYRFKQNDVLNVVDTTAEAGIEKGIEYDVTVWYLDSAIYLVLKGEDGVGIEDIVTETSGEIGGTNTVTIILSDGRQKSFTVLNGSGAVDGDFNPNSNHPVSNSVITERFNAVDTAIAGLFGDVDYDSQTKSIRFYNKNKSAILATLDAKPFIKDGMVNSVYISNNTLVITFNTDAGREAIGVPLTSVFNPNNYYTKVQVDSRIATALDNLNLSNYYTKSQTDRIVGKKADVSNDGKVPVSEATPVVLDYIYAPAPGPVIPINHQAGEVIYFANEHKIRRYYYEDAGQSGGLPAIVYVEETPSKYVVYYNKGNEKFYRYDAGLLSMVEIETGRGDGTVTGVKVGSTTYEPTDGVVDISASIPDVDTAIAGLADVARTGDYDDLENKPTIPDVSNLATKSELQGKANASDVYTKLEVDNALALKQGNITDLEQIRAGATLGASSYQKPHSGIPASDLADGVIPDVSGFATSSDVADAVADLVDSAPSTLDTLKELADALGDDPNFATTMTTALGNKVDKVSGKGLSTEDYTTAEKSKLEGLSNYDDTALQAAVAGKVDKETGKSLMTDAERTKLAGIEAGAKNSTMIVNVTSINQGLEADYTFAEILAAIEDGKNVIVINSGDEKVYQLSYYDSYEAYFTSCQGDEGIFSCLVFDENGVDFAGETSIPSIDNTLSNSSTSPVENRVITAALANKQDTLTFDNAPTANSNNPVKSGGVYTALAGKANGADLATVATSGSYNDLSNKPTLFSGNYNDLTNKPTIPAAQVNADWNASSGVMEILNKPTIPTKFSDLVDDSDYITAQDVASIVVGSADVVITETASHICITFVTTSISFTPNTTMSLWSGQKVGTLTVSGTHLKQDITLTVPANFTAQVSGGTAAQSITIPQTGGEVTGVSVTITYTGVDSGSYNGSITATSGSATASVGLVYSQYQGATIIAGTISTINAAMGGSRIGELNVSGVNLEGDITASVGSGDFTICATENGTYGSTATISKSSAEASGGATLYVKYTPSSGTSTASGTLTLSTPKADSTTTESVSLQGAVSTLTLSTNSVSISTDQGVAAFGTFTINGSNLTNGVTLALTDANSVFSLSKNSLTKAEAESGETITVTYNSSNVGSHSGSIAVVWDGGTETITLSGTAAQPTTSDAEGKFIKEINGKTLYLKRKIVDGQKTNEVEVHQSNYNTGWQEENVADTYSGNIVIPSTVVVDGVSCNITTIASNAFRFKSKKSQLTSLTLPEGITTIGSYFLYQAQAVTSIIIPSTVTTIGGGFCSRASNLETIDMQCQKNTNFQTTWGDANNPHCMYCTKLTSFVIPDKVQRIVKGTYSPFQSCPALTEITLGTDMIVFRSLFSVATGVTKIYCRGTTPPVINESNSTTDYIDSTVIQNAQVYVPTGYKQAYLDVVDGRTANGKVWNPFEQYHALIVYNPD